MNVNLKPGDIVFLDSDKTGAKIIKYLMRSPTFWVDLYRIVTKTVQPSNYYHPFLVVSPNLAIEQQFKVQYKNLDNPYHNDVKYLVARKINLTSEQIQNLINIAEGEKGQLWGIINVWGKFLTWLTGIKLFGRIVRWPTQEVSALRIARWIYLSFGETFGQVHYEDNTTKTMYEYVLAHPEEWAIIASRTN